MGTVREAEGKAADGDQYFWLWPDRGYLPMLNAVNRQKGGIHVEIIPADQLGCVRGEPVSVDGYTGLGSCTGAHVKYPSKGDHVRVVGAYVLDSSNGWFEIHPAWLIRRAK